MSKTFTAAIKDFSELPEKVVRGTLIGMGSRIIKQSPVADPSSWKRPDPSHVGGRFRANWQFSIDAPASGAGQAPDQSAGNANAQLLASAGKMVAGNTFYMTNNVPYAERLEYGWSGQAPNGIVRVVLSQYKTFIEEVAKK